MKVKRFRYGYRKTASALHRKVGDCLRSSSLSGFQIHQEYPVNLVNTNFRSGREKFDWVILDIHVVIECHGQQHTAPASFGGIGVMEARKIFEAQKIRDEKKKQAALSAGWTYFSIPHTDEDKISETYILDLIGRNFNDKKSVVPAKESSTDYRRLYQEKRARERDSGREAIARERNAAYRKQQYQRRKEWLASKEGKNED